MAKDLNFLIGGEAGQGVQTMGLILARALARYGYFVFADQDYESRVRGGHNFFRVRASNLPINAIAEGVDCLIALNRETIDLHRNEMAANSVVFYDSEKTPQSKDKKAIGIPAAKLAIQASGDNLAVNTVLITAVLATCGYAFESLAELLREFFKDATAENNIKAAQAVYLYLKENPAKMSVPTLQRISSISRMLLTGNEAMALGAVAAGCKFLAAYPMTPITPIIEYIATKADELGIVVVPAEDEIAAINMVIGTGYAGVRAMTTTSGGGFCLMAEGLGLAGMTETPIVVIEGQRPGPAIGLPTRQEQGDLEFVLHASQGEFPRVVLTPATTEESFWTVVKAFNLADKYQVPVIVMSDHHLATSYATVNRFDLTKVEVDRGLLYRQDSTEYQRYLFTANGVSPRAFPGTEGYLVITDSDEHDELGHLTEDPIIRNQMMKKRLGKMALLKKEIKTPIYHGSETPDTILIGWGSTFGAIREATEMLSAKGAKIGHLHLSEIWPFPGDAFTDIIQACPNNIVAENNATGQLAKLIQRETCVKVNSNILRYDGRPFTPGNIISALNVRSSNG